MTTKKEPHPHGVPRQATNIDAHVGRIVKRLRILRGLNQTQLAEALGITFQQVQKYERGFNRIGASRLWSLHLALQVPVEYFFADLEPHLAITLRDDKAPLDVTSRIETLKLVRAYYRISDRATRRSISAVVRAIAGDPETEIDADPGDDTAEGTYPLLTAPADTAEAPPPETKARRARKGWRRSGPKVSRGVLR